MRLKRQPAFGDEALEPGVVVVRHLMKTARQQILSLIVLAFLVVGQIAVARVEALGEQQQSADAVPILLELAGVRKLVGVPLRVIGPDVLNLVSLLSSLRIL